MSKIETLATITNGYLANEQLNSNFTKITTALSNTVSRDGSTPNTLSADLDMNNNQLINLPTPTTNFQAATKKYVDDSTDSLTIAQAVTDCQTAQTAAELAETNAETSETNAATSAASAAASAAVILSVKGYGATGDNSTDDTTAIQAAEDAAEALGVPVILTFPAGTYAISDSIEKKANVYWEGKGKLRRKDNASPTGANFSLVTADGVDNWGIDGVQFENIDRTTELGVPMTGSVAVGASNTCIDVFDCEHFYIKNCNLTKFAVGIMYRECHYFQIKDNTLDALTGKTVAQIIAGTYSNFSAFSGTGGIQCLYNPSGVSLPSTYYEISGNYIEVAGLDTAIFVLSQTYDKQPCIVTNNIVRGANAGIQCYRGSYTDAGSAPTYNTGVIIANNSIYATQEQGIYIRGSVGGQVLGNYLERCGAGGANGDTSACSIILRVNPFEDDVSATFVSAGSGDVSNDHTLIVSNNRIVDHGNDSESCDAAISCELDNVLIETNGIDRTAENNSNSRGNAILVANGKELKRVTVRNNRIDGIWQHAIYVSDAAKSATLDDYCIVEGNICLGTYTTHAINFNWLGFNIFVRNNIIRADITNAAIKIRQSVFNIIDGNIIRGTNGSGSEGILISGGTDLGACAHYLSGGSVSKSIRRGTGNIVVDNHIFNVESAFKVEETNGNDVTFYGRTARFENNFVDGERFVQDYSGGILSSATNNTKTFAKHDFIPNSDISDTDIAGQYCTASGQHGSTTTATGDATNTSNVITNVSSLDGLGIGIFVTFSAGVTGTAKILDIDVDNDTITLDTDATSTSSTVTITAATPTFAAPALSFLEASATKDPSSLADGAGETLSFTVTGAALGDFVLVAAPYDLQDITVTGYVQAANTVEVRIQNESTGTIDLASGTWKVKVIK